MTRLLTMLRVEGIKVRRTSVVPLLVLTPYVVVLFFFLFAYFDGSRFLRPEHAWRWLGDSVFTFFTRLVLPLWVAVLTAQVASVEHRARAFKHLHVLPVPRLGLYLAKQTFCWLLTLGVVLGLALAVVVGGLVLRWLRPGLGFETAPPIGSVLEVALAVALAATFMVAVHTWLALLRADVAGPVAVGFLATLSVVALGAFDAELVVYHPWAYAAELVAGWTDGGAVPWVWAGVGVVTGGVLALVAGWSFVARDVT